MFFWEICCLWLALPLAADGSIKLAAAIPKKDPAGFIFVATLFPFPFLFSSNLLAMEALLVLVSSWSSIILWGSRLGSLFPWPVTPSRPSGSCNDAKDAVLTDEDWGCTDHVMSDSFLRFFARSLMATSGSFTLPLFLFWRFFGGIELLKKGQKLILGP